MAEPLTLRVFLALPLAPSFQSEISPLIVRLKKQYPKIRWVSPESIHITLHFFGSVSEEDIPRIASIVTPLTAAAPPLEVSLQGLGVFPNFSRPRVIWLGMHGDIDLLNTLQQKLEEGFRKSGFPCEDRDFKPHLTLGRLKDSKPCPGIEQVEFPATETKQINEIVLFQSHLTPQGAQYEIISTYALSSS